MNTDCLSNFFKYDPDTGAVYWIANGKGRIKKKAAGTKLKSGYIGICHNGKRYMAHRIAWFLYHGKWPEDQIDHINGERADNRICNLREATNSQNGKNLKINANNKTGVTGVCFDKQTQKWRAYIRVDFKMIDLGRFADFNYAVDARRAAEKKYFGDWLRGQS